MNIIMLTESLGSGGAERQLCILAVEMKRRGHCVQVVTYAPGDFYRPMLQEADVKHVFLGGNGTWGWLRKIRSFLRHNQQDVVLAFLQTCAAYAELSALPYRKWGLVVSERSALPSHNDGESRLRKYLHLIADAVTVNSHTNRLMLEAAVPALKNRIVTIYNAVDLNRFKPSIGLKKNKDFRLVVAARIDQNKNLMGTIDAIGFLRDRHGIRVSVDWFGNTAAEFRLVRQCESRIKELRLSESFHLYPPTSDIISKYQQADAVLLPSFYEGLPNTVCEGMACGKPVLMSAVCDAGNLVKEGQNGFLFSPHDPNDIAKAIEKLASLTEAQRHAMGEVSRQMAEVYFDLNKIADLYESILVSASMRQHPHTGHWLPEVPWTAIEYVNANARS
jgi:glycosyltransferase involved in cell wall biosynthesis